MQLTSSKILHFQRVAELLARRAGKKLIEKQHTAKIVKSKSDLLDIVTEADEASEKIIVAGITQHFPEHNVYSEESGDHQKKSPFRWTIDPLDCTKEYARGMSTFCVIISLEYEEKLIVGVAYFPATNELYSAAITRGTSQNKKRLQVNRTHTLGQAIVATHPPRNDLTRTQFDAAWKLFGDLTYSVYRARHIAFDIFNLSQVALGAYEAALIPFPYPKWWDIAAGIIMVTEAGGVVTTSKGNRLTLESYRREGLLASNGLLHEELLKIINEK